MAFEAARAHAVTRDPRFHWDGPAKMSPGRRFTARPVFTITDDGLGRGVVEVRRVADGALVARSAEMVTAGAESVFRRAAAAFKSDLSAGRTGDTMSALRFQLADLGAALTDAERTEFEALAATQRQLTNS
ncbi:hypothetical protein ACGFJ7_29470 [Actinoplanes sp. NPDC048988]|uniref:hypothetical protein n=1 Tax=Actinoplanes sp. NPDC048988 TaxID=3363901 RepID=UPI003713A30B